MIKETTGVHEALSTIVRLAGNTTWVLGGSAALMLRGLPLGAPPRDIDLYCDEADMDDIHKALSGCAIDSPELSETDIYRSTLSHYRIGSVQVELVGGFSVQALGCCYEVEVRKVLLPYGEALELGGQSEGKPELVRIVPLAHELWFNTLRKRVDRVAVISAEMRKAPHIHQPALQAIEEGNDMADDVARAVCESVAGAQRGEQPWMQK